ncbi:MAG: type II CAAX endopeptidase family protein [Lachnospiraceae bacterium]|nr:type II CAAX endopeptidase family protein [Lachnospiraceae bacterium]
MKKNPHKINSFLIIYLILYLSLSQLGGFFISYKLLSRIVQILPVILGILYLIMTRQPILSSVKIKKFRPSTILLTILFTYCLWPLVSIVNQISMLFSHNMIDSVVNQTVAQTGLLYSIITMAFLPACIEEFTFRGLIYGQYRNQRPIKAILLSSLCFGLMHLNFNQFSYAFVLGIFMTLLLEASGSLIPPIIMHFTFNATSVSIVFVQQKVLVLFPELKNTLSQTSYTSQQLLSSIASMVPIAIIGCLLAFLIYSKIARINGNWKEICCWKDLSVYRERPNYKLGSIGLYAFVIICLIMCILMEIFK